MKYLITAADGKKYDTNHYNLQMIIAVGFKVNFESDYDRFIAGLNKIEDTSEFLWLRGQFLPQRTDTFQLFYSEHL
jgi:hypothetical protein